jgi:hypothetical protein
MSEDKEKKIHANEESGEEVEAHVKRRDALDEGAADTNDDDNDVEAHVRSHRG